MAKAAASASPHRLGGAIIIVFALIVLAGGVTGYVSEGSIPSIAMSSVFATLLTASGVMAMATARTGWLQFAMAVKLLLTIFFTVRFARSRVFLPSGLMGVVTVVAFGLLVYQVEKARQMDKRAVA
ncbi:unnamed protein product [Vitrella brassicaformis CCMP3155]|uniref:Uncharacterized protein n=1 Tax=Vitrella brassicaformis (strain CCMP3155) TaxID=1169540 RepID=A0A0G4GJR3_VITBC|nr:unnamed protein product [Vitrella brassicaformis CCMP3155]|mmetsp:Transcript_21484/g.52598  ORF Transcript_21484/g.52598 Transcript_21484/m.52598 type:complete len:126 (-) Transcript_21484:139-516(-)|eukprot:CEM30164.1 unnamed protein product [Vitrella brassicaformis CCMP3155]